MTFSPEAIADLLKGRGEAHDQKAKLEERLLRRTYHHARAKEFAEHGLLRRLSTMVHCIDVVFDRLPPDLVEVPERATISDATISLQAFTANVFGCLDNLAWIWICERDLRANDGTPMLPRRIGLGPRYREIWRSLPVDLRERISGYEEWFRVMGDFRDALVHRIPFYIPPFTIDPARSEDFQRLETEKWSALTSRSRELYEAKKREQGELRRFQPFMLHSLTEKAPPIYFHGQILADFNTVDDVAHAFLDALDHDESAAAEAG
jgi:hypothetical protein